MKFTIEESRLAGQLYRLASSVHYLKVNPVLPGCAVYVRMHPDTMDAIGRLPLDWRESNRFVNRMYGADVVVDDRCAPGVMELVQEIR